MTTVAIVELAREQGLGELSEQELDYLETSITYDWYAVQPQMPYDVAFDRGQVHKTLKATATPERFQQIEKFFIRNWQEVK